MIFYDFEVFKYDWLIVAADTKAKQEFILWNNRTEFEKFCNEHMNEIWVGCNNVHYDQYIKKAILCGFDPYEVSQRIIVDGCPGYSFSSALRNFKFIEYDVMTRIDRGLKVWEGFLGNTIKETSVPFDIQRPLTGEEKQETEQYCISDVKNTMNVFMEKINDFNAIMGLIQSFPEVLNIYDLSSTKAQISSKILECKRIKRTDEFDLFVLPCIEVGKYSEAIQFFMQFKDRSSADSKEIYSHNHVMNVAGLEHSVGWGGIHAGKEKYHCYGATEGKQIWHVDVASFYPRLMIFHKLLTRNSFKPEKFKQIYDTRIALKKAGKKAEQAPLKIVINGTYGISKSNTSEAYDPRNANLICMNGQLMLIDLISHLEKINGFELIQSNTDGLIIALPNNDAAFEEMDEVCYEWETRCNMELEFDEISEIHQKDVNNYIFKFSSGKLERKGSYVKELTNLDNDLPIVNRAVVDFLINNVPVEKTIYSSDRLIDFQQIKKIGAMYDYIYHNGKRLSERVVRCFASKNPNDGMLLMKHNSKTTFDKIAGTPEHCFLFNSDVHGAVVPLNLDRNWYIDLAKKRLNDFGVMA